MERQQYRLRRRGFARHRSQLPDDRKQRRTHHRRHPSQRARRCPRPQRRRRPGLGGGTERPPLPSRQRSCAPAAASSSSAGPRTSARSVISSWAERVARSAGWTGAALLRQSGRAVRFVSVDAGKAIGALGNFPRTLRRDTPDDRWCRQHGPRHRDPRRRGGHRVEIIDRDPAEAQQLAKDLGGGATELDPGSRFGGEVVVFAVYYPGIKDAVRQYADQLAGKVVVDITNPVDTQTWDRLATPPAPPPPRRSSSLSRRGHPW
jgi:hypothetical protein